MHTRKGLRPHEEESRSNPEQDPAHQYKPDNFRVIASRYMRNIRATPQHFNMVSGKYQITVVNIGTDQQPIMTVRIVVEPQVDTINLEHGTVIPEGGLFEFYFSYKSVFDTFNFNTEREKRVYSLTEGLGQNIKEIVLKLLTVNIEMFPKGDETGEKQKLLDAIEANSHNIRFVITENLGDYNMETREFKSLESDREVAEYIIRQQERLHDEEK